MLEVYEKKIKDLITFQHNLNHNFDEDQLTGSLP